MAIYIAIKKVKNFDEMGIYEVTSEQIHFYIEIDTVKKIICFSENESFDMRWLLDFNDLESTIDIPWVPPRIIHAIFVKGKNVIETGVFSENISFCA